MIPANTLERHGQSGNASGAPLWPNNAKRGFGFYKKHSGKVSYILASKKKINNIQCVRLYTV